MRGVCTILYIALVLSLVCSPISYALEEDTSLVLDDIKITTGPENLEVKLFVTNNEDAVIDSSPVVYIYDSADRLIDRKKLKEYLFLPRKKTTVLVLYENSFLPDGKYTIQSAITFGSFVGKQSNIVAKQITISGGKITAVEATQALPMKLGNGKLFYSILGSLLIIGLAALVRRKNHGPLLHNYNPRSLPAYGAQSIPYTYQKKSMLSSLFSRKQLAPQYGSTIVHPGVQPFTAQSRIAPIQSSIVPRQQIRQDGFAAQFRDDLHQEVGRVENQLIHFNKTIEEDKKRIHLLERTLQTQATEMQQLQEKMAKAKSKQSFLSRLFRTETHAVEKQKELIVKPPELEEIMQRALEEKLQLQQELKAIEQARKDYEMQKRAEDEARHKKEKESLALLKKEFRDKEEKRLKEEKEKQEKARKEYSHIFDSTHDLIRGKISVLSSIIEEPEVVNRLEDDEVEQIVNKMIGKKPAMKKHAMETKSSFLQRLQEMTRRHEDEEHAHQSGSAQILSAQMKPSSQEMPSAKVISTPLKETSDMQPESAHVLTAPLKQNMYDEHARAVSAPMRYSHAGNSIHEHAPMYAYMPKNSRGFFARLFGRNEKSTEKYQEAALIRDDIHQITKSLAIKRKELTNDETLTNELLEQTPGNARIKIAGAPGAVPAVDRQDMLPEQMPPKKQRSWLSRLFKRHRHIEAKEIYPKTPPLYKQPIFGTTEKGSFKLEIREVGKEKEQTLQQPSFMAKAMSRMSKKIFSRKRHAVSLPPQKATQLPAVIQKEQNVPAPLLSGKATTVPALMFQGREDPEYKKYAQNLEEFLKLENRKNTFFNRFLHVLRSRKDPVEEYKARAEMMFSSNETETSSFVKQDTVPEVLFTTIPSFMPQSTKLKIDGVEEDKEVPIPEKKHTPTFLQRCWRYMQKKKEVHELEEKLKLVEERAKQLEEEKSLLENEPRLVKENNSLDGGLRLKRHTPVEERSLNILETSIDSSVKLDVPELEEEPEVHLHSEKSFSHELKRFLHRKMFPHKKRGDVEQEKEEPHILKAVITTPHIEEIATVPENTQIGDNGKIIRKAEVESVQISVPVHVADWNAQISSPYLEEDIPPEEEISLLQLVKRRLELGIEKKKQEVITSIRRPLEESIVALEQSNVVTVPLLKVKEDVPQEAYFTNHEMIADVTLDVAGIESEEEASEPKEEVSLPLGPPSFTVNIVKGLKDNDTKADEVDKELDEYDRTFERKLPLHTKLREVAPPIQKTGVLSKLTASFKKRYVFEAESLAHAIEPHKKKPVVEQKPVKSKHLFSKLLSTLKGRYEHEIESTIKTLEPKKKAVRIGAPIIMAPLVKEGQRSMPMEEMPKYTSRQQKDDGKPHPFKVDVLSVESADEGATIRESEDELERYDRRMEKTYPGQKKYPDSEPYKKSIFTRFFTALKRRSEYHIDSVVETIEPHRKHAPKKKEASVPEVHPMTDLLSAVKKRYVHEVEHLAHTIEPKGNLALTQGYQMDAHTSGKLTMRETSPSRLPMRNAQEMDGRVTVKAGDITIPNLKMPTENETKDPDFDTVEIDAPQQWNINVIPKKVEDALLKRALLKLNKKRKPVILQEKKSIFSKDTAEVENELDPSVKFAFFKENRSLDPSRDLELPITSQKKGDEPEFTDEDAKSVMEFVNQNKKPSEYPEITAPIQDSPEKGVDPETFKQFLQVNKRPTEHSHMQKPINPIHKAVYAPLTTTDQSKDPIFDEKKRRALQKIDDALKKLGNK